MKTSLTTFERKLRRAVLDVVYAQWQALGVPLSSGVSDHNEVIDPEALLWCSLEFVPTEPRLGEGVFEWVRASPDYLIRQRVNRLALAPDPRSCIWCVIDHAKQSRSLDDPKGRSDDACHGLSSRQEVLAYCRSLKPLLERPSSRPIGQPSETAETLLLRARDLLGNDVRHFVLVYLLSNRHGGKIRTIQKWSGYSYRSISDAATRWERAKVVSIDHGYCRLADPVAWHSLLKHESERAVIVDWIGAFGACVRLLRALAKAGRKKLATEGSVVSALVMDTTQAIASALLTDGAPIPQSLAQLQRVLLDKK